MNQNMTKPRKLHGIVLAGDGPLDVGRFSDLIVSKKAYAAPRMPQPMRAHLSAPYFGMQLTPWFSPRRKEYPVRDGVYLARHITAFGASESWHAFRWNGNAMAWYSADSEGAGEADLIGASANNVHHYEWCGLLNGGSA